MTQCGCSYFFVITVSPSLLYTRNFLCNCEGHPMMSSCILGWALTCDPPAFLILRPQACVARPGLNYSRNLGWPPLFYGSQHGHCESWQGEVVRYFHPAFSTVAAWEDVRQQNFVSFDVSVFSPFPHLAISTGIFLMRLLVAIFVLFSQFKSKFMFLLLKG